MVRWVKGDWKFTFPDTQRVWWLRSLTRVTSGPQLCTWPLLWDSFTSTNTQCPAHSFFWCRNSTQAGSLAHRINCPGLCTKAWNTKRWLLVMGEVAWQQRHADSRVLTPVGQGVQSYGTRSRVSNKQAGACKSQSTTWRFILTCLLPFYLRCH